MASQLTSDYPTLREVLRLPAFAGCTVCGGGAGLDRRVGGVNLTDTPDDVRFTELADAVSREIVHRRIPADRSARTALYMAEQTGTPCVTDDPAGVICLLESASPAETALYLYRYRRA